MRCNYGGPVYRMDDIVPQSSQHRRPLVCIQGLLIEFGLMLSYKGPYWPALLLCLERNRCGQCGYSNKDCKQEVLLLT